MPNLVTAFRNRVLAVHPEAVLAERTLQQVRYRIADAPDGRQRFRIEASLGPLHYRDGAAWAEIDTDWGDSGEAGFVDGNESSGLVVHSDGNGRRRIYPRRGVRTEFIEFSRLQAWNGAAFVNVPWSSKQRVGNTITFDRANASLSIIHEGSRLKVNVVLKDSSAAARIRWPVTLTGLTRQGSTLFGQDGQPVLTIKPPKITADANGFLVPARPVTWDFVGGAVEFTADLSGLTFPITIDPTATDTVSAADRDAKEQGDDTNFGTTFLFVRSATSAATRMFAMQVFTLTGPASGDTIDAAKVTNNVNTGGGRNNDPNLNIFCEDVDSAANFTTTADIYNRVRTTASVSWIATDVAANGADVDTPDFASVVQEVTDRAGWASGNLLGVIYVPNEDSTLLFGFDAYEDDTSTCGRRSVTYTAAGGGSDGLTPGKLQPMGIIW